MSFIDKRIYFILHLFINYKNKIIIFVLFDFLQQMSLKLTADILNHQYNHIVKNVRPVTNKFNNFYVSLSLNFPITFSWVLSKYFDLLLNDL